MTGLREKEPEEEGNKKSRRMTGLRKKEPEGDGKRKVPKYDSEKRKKERFSSPFLNTSP